VLTALIAVAAAGRRAARVRPTVALQESAGTRRLIGPLRVLGGLAMAAIGFGLLGVATTDGDPSTSADMAAGASFAFVMAVAMLGPLVVRVVAALASTVLGRTRGSVSAFLAVSNMRTAAGRFASATTPLVLTVAISATLLFAGTTREHATAAQERDRVVADLVVQSDGPGVPQDAVAAIRRTPGVRAAVGVKPTTLGPGLGSTYAPVQAAAVDTPGAAHVLDLDVRDGTLAALHGHAVALSRGQAAKAHAVVGERVPITLGDGTHIRARVVAIYERGLGFGDVVVPSSLTQGHMTSPLVSMVLVRADSGAAVADLAARLNRVARGYPGMTVGDRQDHTARADHDRETNNWLFRILAGIIFVFTAIAVVNTLTMIALHRTRELALLRLVGGTRRQVIAMSRWEGGLTVGLGLGIGAAIALVTLVPTAAVMGSSPSAPLALVGLVFGSAAAVGLIATQVATRIALRPRPVDGIGVGE
jgi:putative ABC transport system permease protein